MTEHTPTPWNCASRYSSICGVPIINQQGKRVGNTALPDMPPEWDHMKRQAEIDAAFICKAVNNHDALDKALAIIDGELKFYQEEYDRKNLTDLGQHSFSVLRGIRERIGRVVGREREPS